MSNNSVIRRAISHGCKLYGIIDITVLILLRGSVQIFLLFFIGAFSGRALDAGLFRPIYVSGLVIQLIGVFMTSISTKYWQLFLAQGVCTGIGNGLQFCPAIGLVSTYFSTKKSRALAFCACGGATGGMIFPAMVSHLLPQLGQGWMIRVLGFFQMGIGALTVALFRTRLPPRKAGPLVDWTAFKEPTYMLFVLGMCFKWWGLYFAIYYVCFANPEVHY